MKFAVYKLNFAAGVHLGTGTLVSGANTLPADTLFSALCMEAAQQGEKSIKTLVDAVRQSQQILRLSERNSTCRNRSCRFKGKTRAIPS